MVEVHARPAESRSDAEQALHPGELRELGRLLGIEPKAGPGNVPAGSTGRRRSANAREPRTSKSRTPRKTGSKSG
jgi:hypothetical protein